MAAAIVTPAVALDNNVDRCEAEEESRGVELEEEGSQQQSGPAAAVTHIRLSKLPLARIKALMKTDPDVSLASQESVFVIAKATVNEAMQPTADPSCCHDTVSIRKQTSQDVHVKPAGEISAILFKNEQSRQSWIRNFFSLSLLNYVIMF